MINHDPEPLNAFQWEDHVMSEAEAAALSDTEHRNRPTIPVKPRPTRPRMKLTRTTNYKVHVRTANDAQVTLRFNTPPTADLIADALWYTKVNVPEPVAPTTTLEAGRYARDPRPNEAELRYERERTRYDNLIALVKLAEIKLPKPGKNEPSDVIVAGVQIGYINITAHEAWTQPSETCQP